jgi:hypothetical protein
MNLNANHAALLREKHPRGTRIRLIEMNDPFAPVPPGTEGTLDFIDDACQYHMKWDNGSTLALIPDEDRFSVILPPLQTLKLYMPLTVMLYERNRWGDLEDEGCELDRYNALAYEDNILAAIIKERMPEEAERGLMEYYGEDDSVNHKVQSYVFTVERVGNKLMGVAECRIHGELSDQELERLKEDISGQAADGFGEGFEQRAIKIANGEIYVSLWSSDKNWNIMTKDELEQHQQMGGMTLE